MEIDFSPIEPSDWEAVRNIYQQGIDTGNATFQTAAPEWHAWDAGHLPHCRLLARSGGNVLGWAALSRVSAREVYSGVAEVSIYIEDHARGHGVGDALLGKLIVESEQNGIWTLQAGIFPENQASLALHGKHGFRVVGRRERVGRLHGQWRDTVLLERRSKVVGY